MTLLVKSPVFQMKMTEQSSCPMNESNISPQGVGAVGSVKRTWSDGGVSQQSPSVSLLYQSWKKMEGKQDRLDPDQQQVFQSAVCKERQNKSFCLLEQSEGTQRRTRKRKLPRGLISCKAFTASLHRNTPAYGSPATVKLPLVFSRLIRLDLLMATLKSGSHSRLTWAYQ